MADLERRAEQAMAATSSKLKLKAMMIEAQSGLQAEMQERATYLDQAMALFAQLGEEIYSDRGVTLWLEATDKGSLKVAPRIDGDASTGISEVKTFHRDYVLSPRLTDFGEDGGLFGFRFV
ncbi:MAG: hypothetical protein LBK72_05525 [Bifidobacteriaceae bacterium]|nr:hypothetical protein [Bifidobacteriaceae bacterium]